MKKIVLWQVIVSVVVLAVFFSDYRIGGPNIAVGAVVITVVAAAFITAAVTTAPFAAAIVAIITTLAVPAGTSVFAVIVVTILIFAAANAHEINGETNDEVTFPQLLGSYVAEAAALYGIMTGFLRGMVLSVWLPTLIAAIVSAILFAVVPLARLRTRPRA